MKALTYRLPAVGVLFVLFTAQLFGADVSKQIAKAFALKANTAVSIDNKFGNIIINRWEKTTLELKVTLTVSGKSESSAQEVLNDINIKITDNISSGKLDIVTVTKENKNEKSSFSINYEINMPGNVPMKLVNSFGNIVMGSHSGPLDVTVKFGQLIAEDLANANIAVEFSNAKCEIETVTSGTIDLRFGKLMIGEVGNVKISSQHSDINIGDAQNITLDGRHGNIDIEKVKILRGTLEFAGLKIGKLEESIVIDSKHGNGLALSEVASSFREIALDSQFSPVDIALQAGTQAKLYFNLEFGNLKANGEGINFSKVIKEQTTSQYEGFLGKSTASGLVRINSKYGNIRFDVN
ncbi:MAG: hypothetical protein U5K79_11605 [Cyclobacteriaceae bacterium]|nr:hypothetical protein [Cyclobacteriaceae bacterium]